MEEEQYGKLYVYGNTTIAFDQVKMRLDDAERTLVEKVPEAALKGTSAWHQLQALRELSEQVERLARCVPGVTGVHKDW